MRKTNIWAATLGAATVLSYGCFRASHPSHRPDAEGNAAPIKDVASVAHAREIPQLEPYDAVDHLYRNAKSSLPTSVRLAVLDTADWTAIWKRIVGTSSTARRSYVPICAGASPRAVVVVIEPPRRGA